jgi:hypothetical protein
MKRIFALGFAGLATMTLLAGPMAARAADTTPEPKGGTVKGAAVGAVAGHVMGGHTKTGAAVGAVAGHHEKVKSQERINAGGKP